MLNFIKVHNGGLNLQFCSPLQVTLLPRMKASTGCDRAEQSCTIIETI